MKPIASPDPPIGIPDFDLAGAGLAVEEIETSPCTRACPAGINVKSYVSLVGQHRFEEAMRVIRDTCPLPSVCGRVCTHPCEETCRLGETGEAVAIRALKRFVADRCHDLPPPATAPERSTPVAIVGSGPAGLTAAWDLRLMGYPVTVFEAEAEPGGMLRYGIAVYRLPRDVLRREIGQIEKTGVEIHANRRLGCDFTLESLFDEGYRAVLVATGGGHGRRLGLPGEAALLEVEDALAFLHRANEGDRKSPGKRVVVIGGGSTAIEAARTAVRLGAERVEILYRRSLAEMPASGEEIDEAIAEGVLLRYLVAPDRIIEDDGRLVGLRCLEVELGEADSSGRRRPVVIPGSEFDVAADRVLAAVGQVAELDFLPPRLLSRLDRRKGLAVDPATGMTELKGVFAAGDVVTGPATVAAAVGAGHDSARAIHRWIEGRATGGRETPSTAPEFGFWTAPPKRPERRHPPTRHPTGKLDFDEVELAFTEDDAVAEANRCLRCGPCDECHVCAPSCDHRHLRVESPSGGSLELRAPASLVGRMPDDPVRTRISGVGRSVSSEAVDRAGESQFVLAPVRGHIETERCRACGACIEICPFTAIDLEARTAGSDPKARIDLPLCRGCELCTAVCPTGAAESMLRDASWWDARASEALASSEEGGAPTIVLACERRAAELKADGRRVIGLPCAGAVTGGRLLDLVGRGAGRIEVATCTSGSCRFVAGPELASAATEQARDLLGLMGLEARVQMEDKEVEHGDVH